MSLPHEQQIAALTEKLNSLENESRRILKALQWSTKVRLILFAALLLFVLASGLMFYMLYQDIKQNRIAAVQRIIREQPEDFSEPLTRQIKLLAEEQGPYVLDVFRKQTQEDSQKYVKAFDAERTTLVNNLQKDLEGKLTQSYATMLDEQESTLKEKFPVLNDAKKMENVRNNMEKVYQKIGQRYYVDYMKDELEEITDKLDRFPGSEPRQDNIPISEQIASEFLELVRMMLIETEGTSTPITPVSVDVPAKSELPASNSQDGTKADSNTKVDDDANKSESKSDKDKSSEAESADTDDDTTESN